MNCPENDKPIFTTANVVELTEIQKGIFQLELEYSNDKVSTDNFSGKFFMLKACPSALTLSRPISVFHAETLSDGIQRVVFLILLKGQGTKELCSLKIGDKVSLIGPLGNSFQPPLENEKCCIIGGGIGVAPVAGFAESLNPNSYDFYACFKTGGYGLDKIKPAKMVITTDDGSRGKKGMLPDVLTASELKQSKYSSVYACGPEPMLAYVQKICEQADIPCYLSMEARMACGMGACLGCTITTKQGNKRCCKDGPVFLGQDLVFLEKKKSVISVCNNENIEPTLEVNIAGVKFENPIIAASGTFGYGNEYESLIEINRLGGICSKGLTLEPKAGNTGIRLQETSSGIINSIGLENPGISTFIKEQLPKMLSLKPVTIANLSGSSLETYVEGATLLSKTAVPMIELNISCPNVKAGGMAFGLQPEAAAEVTAAVRKAAPNKSLMVKLSPNAPDVIEVAHAVRQSGADAISLINTVQAIAIDIEKGVPLFDNIRAGLSGPAIKPLALRLVYDLVKSMNSLPEKQRIPVIGLGGISCWQDAIEFIMVGATALQVGTATFANPTCMTEIIDGMVAFMKRKGFKKLEDFRGIAQI
ncbi:MAG: dihydroorotate dehydrogenase [Spirochaetaceae bacterium]|nr:dihydroorotate dehydrogenase [Spirochaetaceae bacterium]